MRPGSPCRLMNYQELLAHLQEDMSVMSAIEMPCIERQNAFVPKSATPRWWSTMLAWSAGHTCSNTGRTDPSSVRGQRLGAVLVTKAFLPAMVRHNRGHIVTLASAAGLVGVARQTDYSASKHAAVGFDESLRAELREISPGVMTTLVCPYYVDTGMFEGVRTRIPFLLPILRQRDVVHKIANAIERDRRLLVLPPAVHLFRYSVFFRRGSLTGSWMYSE